MRPLTSYGTAACLLLTWIAKHPGREWLGAPRGPSLTFPSSSSAGSYLGEWVKKHKTLHDRRSNKARAEPLKSVNVSLDTATIKMAVKLGRGDLSLGIRRAVALRMIRQLP